MTKIKTYCGECDEELVEEVLDVSPGDKLFIDTCDQTSFYCSSCGKTTYIEVHSHTE